MPHLPHALLAELLPGRAGGLCQGAVWGGWAGRVMLCGWRLPQDRVSTIRSLCIGISAHQKLEPLSSLVTLLGYESLAVFGDCFDEARPLPAPLSDAAMPGWSSSCMRLAGPRCLRSKPLGAARRNQ